MSNIIGIDFGTTNCCVAVVKNGNAEVIPNRSGNRITPTLVTFIKSGETLIGEKAAQYAVKNSKQTVVSVKRYIGKDRPFFNGTEMYSPIEISAIVLRELRRNAEDYLGETVTEAVVTVPAYYNDLQRQATKDAAGIAGLNVVKMINEPTSAALAYSLDHSVLQRVLVFDLGGGTFDVSVIEIRSGIVEVLATNGDNRLGGDDFDERLVEHFLELIHRERRFSIRRHPDALFRLIEAARTAKEILSSEESYAISVPVLTSGRHMFDFEYTLTRKKFNELCADLFDRLEEPVQDVLVDAQLAASELDKVILVGGSTHIPAVQDKIKELTGLTPLTDIDPDECVAIGAAIQGFALLQAHEGRNDVDLPLLIDVISQSLSIETAGGIATKIVERNSVLPIRCTKVFSLPNTNRKGVELNILQGEHPIAKHNVSIGRIRLEDICSETPGEKRIEVTFNIDTNGILNIKARDPDTGNEQSVTISGRLQMSSTGIKRSMNHINHTITATK